MSASLYYLFLLFLSLYRNLPFVISVKVFLRGNCYALPLSYCRCIPSFCIGINLLLRTLMFEVLVCLWLYINTQVIICQYFFQIFFKNRLTKFDKLHSCKEQPNNNYSNNYSINSENLKATFFQIIKQKLDN